MAAELDGFHIEFVEAEVGDDLGETLVVYDAPNGQRSNRNESQPDVPNVAPHPDVGLDDSEEDEAWKKLGNCRGKNPDIFFPEGRGFEVTRQVNAAKEIYRKCVVIDSCLEYAIRNGETHGVWGGQAKSEIIKIRRRRNMGVL